MILTALEALNLAAPIADAYMSVEERLLVQIARQISLNDDHQLNEVSRWQIKQLAKHGLLRQDAHRIIAAGTKGIPAFVDKSGREWSPEAYVNMDIRATVKNTALEAQFSTMDSLGQDVFEVSSHPGSRPKCRPWQGKLISRSGKTTEITDINGRKHKVIPLSQTSFGEPDGLFGINCGHRPRGVSDGLFRKSSVEYDDEEDKALYNKICKQRELERRVRKSKTEADMLEAAGDTEGAKEVRRKMAEQNKALKSYCEGNGLKYRSDRVRTYGAIAPNKIKVPKPAQNNSQFYKPVVVDKSDQINAQRLVNGKPAVITLNRVTDRHNKIYLSENADIKSKALHEIDTRLTDVYKLLNCEKRKTLPNICIVSHDEMGGPPAAFNALHNALYIDEALLTIEETPEFRAQMACADNRLSTALHECLHWLDADDYRKTHGNITAENYAAEYLPYLRAKCKKKLDKLQDNGYNIYDISGYATRSFVTGQYDEVYTEYRVKEMLKGGTR